MIADADPCPLEVVRAGDDGVLGAMVMLPTLAEGEMFTITVHPSPLPGWRYRPDYAAIAAWEPGKTGATPILPMMTRTEHLAETERALESDVEWAGFYDEALRRAKTEAGRTRLQAERERNLQSISDRREGREEERRILDEDPASAGLPYE
ncbi:MAG: hypothetical protein H6736_08975 [Alphaproteobacteria bacterium]|nr:hypothetical protein [Alphaproteobacteria bacterium]MCB9691935.1 hypothetical protein [Alphaproteobacteria bacterium]